MKRMLNTLYITTQKTYLAREGETVHVRVEKQTKLRVPVHTLQSIVCFGNVTCSPFLLGLCADNNVAVSFLTKNGRFLARVQAPVNGNVLLRREQYRRADGDGAAEIARAIVIAKIANTRSVLMRGARETECEAGELALRAAATHLARLLPRLGATLPLDTIRGIEGDAARTYFGAFDHLIAAQKDAFKFERRSRRPPLDNINALLSFFYTLLAHDVAAALETVGLDPAVGFLHRDRPGRPGLALDLMEELRPLFADRLALTLVNRRQISAKGFTQRETGAVAMDEKTRKTVLIAYQERKQEEIQHPFIQEKVKIGLIPHLQAQLLARHLRGDLDAYPAFLWK